MSITLEEATAILQGITQRSNEACGLVLWDTGSGSVRRAYDIRISGTPFVVWDNAPFKDVENKLRSLGVPTKKDALALLDSMVLTPKDAKRRELVKRHIEAQEGDT